MLEKLPRGRLNVCRHKCDPGASTYYVGRVEFLQTKTERRGKKEKVIPIPFSFSLSLSLHPRSFFPSPFSVIDSISGICQIDFASFLLDVLVRPSAAAGNRARFVRRNPSRRITSRHEYSNLIPSDRLTPHRTLGFKDFRASLIASSY